MTMGETSRGVCKLCGAQKEFRNYIQSEFSTTSENHRAKQRKLGNATILR